MKLGVAKHRIKVENVQNDPALSQIPQIQKVRTRYVPIPRSREIEPWSIELLKWISEKKELRFNFTRRTAQNIVQRNLRGLDPSIHCHSLRHYRITHMMRYYNFDPTDICAYVGWSLRAVYGGLGKPVSSNIDLHSHLTWRDYIDKLVTPLNEIFDR